MIAALDSEGAIQEHLDHVFKPSNKELTWSFFPPEILDIDSDHGVQVIKMNVNTIQRAPVVEETRRVRVRQLKDDDNKQRYIASYNTSTVNYSQLLNRIEGDLINHNLTFIEQNEVLNLLSCSLTSILYSCANDIVGSYNVNAMKTRPDTLLASLNTTTSSVDALKIFKRAKRSSIQLLTSTDPLLTAEEEAFNLFSSIWTVADPSPCSVNFDFHTADEYNPVTLDEVEKAILRYPAGRSGGCDGVDIVMLKAVQGSTFTLHLCQLFNLCLRIGKTPDSWNEAITTLIPKKEDSFTANTSRPISLTLMFRRLFESIMFRRWNKEAWFTPHPWQAGCRRGYSTITHLGLIDHTSKSIFKYTCLLDIAKAFDSVRHSDIVKVLIEKNCPSRELKLIESLFFNNNRTRLTVNGKLSRSINVERGIFQGSVLSPALFSLWIDDLAYKLQDISTYRDPTALFFADDIALKAKSHTEIQTMVKVCEEWGNKRGIAFNVQKCEFIQHQNEPSPAIQLYHEIIPVVPIGKYLGVDIDHQGIDWTSFVSSNSSKAKKILLYIKHHGYNWPCWVKIVIFKAFIRSQLDYAAPLLFTYLQSLNTANSKLLIDKYQEVIDNGLRFIFNLSRDNRLIGKETMLDCSGLVNSEQRLIELQSTFPFHLDTLHEDNPWKSTLLSSRITYPNSLLVRSSRKSALYTEWWRSTDPESRLKDNCIRWLRRSYYDKSRQGNSKQMLRIMKRQDIATRKPDPSTYLSTQRHTADATAWRFNRLFTRKRCFNCTGTWNRGHMSKCDGQIFGIDSLLKEHLHMNEEEVLDYDLAYAGLLTLYEDLGHFTILDFLLNEDLKTKAEEALEWLVNKFEVPDEDVLIDDVD